MGSFDCSEQPLLFPARPNIVDEGLVVDFDKVFVEQPMHETIFDACNSNLSLLGIVHAKGTIGTVTVCLAMKFLMQLTKIFFQVITEVFQFCSVLFSAYKSLPTMPESR